MVGNRICAIALAAAFAAICSTPSAFAAPFDGNWSVVAQTTQGHCGSMRFGSISGSSKTRIKVKNPKAPAATRAVDGSF